MNIIETKKLTKRYGRLAAVDELDMAIPAKSIYGFLGKNGAGKTTTLGILSTLLRPTAGDALIDKNSIIKDQDKVRKIMGLMPQKANFHNHRTALDHMIFYGRLAGVKNPEKEAQELLIKIGLKEKMNSKVGEFSHGMVKLLSLAQAFIGHPKIILLDEPMSGLDPKRVYAIKKFIISYKGKTTIVLSSHYLEGVAKLCTHIGILKKGRLIYQSKAKKGQNLERLFLRYA